MESSTFNDSTHVSGKNELLAWINGLLKLSLDQIENLGTGAAYCQVFDILYPGEMNMSKVSWNGKTEYDFLNNYKLISSLFTKQNIQKNLDSSKLSKCKYQDNLEFCQWIKQTFDQTAGDKAQDYDPVAKRGKTGPSVHEKSVSPFSQNAPTTSMSSSTITKKQTVSTVAPTQTTMTSSVVTTNKPVSTVTTQPTVTQQSSRISRPTTAVPSTTDLQMQKSIVNPLKRKITDVYRDGKKPETSQSIDNKENVHDRQNTQNRVPSFGQKPSLVTSGKGDKGMKTGVITQGSESVESKINQELVEQIKLIVSFDSNTTNDEKIEEIRRLMKLDFSHTTTNTTTMGSSSENMEMENKQMENMCLRSNGESTQDQMEILSGEQQTENLLQSEINFQEVPSN